MKEKGRKILKVRLLAYSSGRVKRGEAYRFSKWCTEQYNVN